MKINYKVLLLAVAFISFVFLSTGFTTGSNFYLDEEGGKALTDQTWAVQVIAEPGESGSLSQNFVAAYGPYVGDYFHIEQEAATTGGTVKRYIDISSPWSGAYLYEDMVVKGISEIKEAFRLNNLEPDESVVLTWYDMF